MVLPAKIFEIKERASPNLMVGKLKDFREEELYYSEAGETTSLVSEVLDLKMKRNSISGVFSKDFMRKRFYQRKLVETPVTEESSFWINTFDKRGFIIISAPSVARGVKKLLTNYVANKLSKILFITPHSIVESKIPHTTLQKLHESSPQATKLIWFDQVDIPGIEKLCLAGSDLTDTEIYRNYLKHGKIWYVVFEVQKQGIVVGITRNCVVTLFSKSTAEEFVDYILEDLLPLIE
ncbi:MAG: hypothetical protein JSW72_06405 [Candidatus Bathyarchaeota archaeon]|nr:MAG: hypothetical protein JSW72_06405 [Candidatus Bathyarchaeota archaeon]